MSILVKIISISYRKECPERDTGWGRKYWWFNEPDIQKHDAGWFYFDSTCRFFYLREPRRCPQHLGSGISLLIQEDLQPLKLNKISFPTANDRLLKGRAASLSTKVARHEKKEHMR